MNTWGIPTDLEAAIIERDADCVYCRRPFLTARESRARSASWEHIINDASIVTAENIARCCVGCNASKGARDLLAWLQSDYCRRNGINAETVAPVIKTAIQRMQAQQ